MFLAPEWDNIDVNLLPVSGGLSFNSRCPGVSNKYKMPTLMVIATCSKYIHCTTMVFLNSWCSKDLFGTKDMDFKPTVTSTFFPQIRTLFFDGNTRFA